MLLTLNLNLSRALLWKCELILESQILRIEILPVLDISKARVDAGNQMRHLLINVWIFRFSL